MHYNPFREDVDVVIVDVVVVVVVEEEEELGKVRHGH